MKFNLIILIVAMALAPTTGMRTSVAAQQSDVLTFKLDICGRGIAPVLSSQSYDVSDGTELSVFYLSYKTARDARKALGKELKDARRIEDRKDQTNEAGKKIGERVIAIVLGSDGTERTVLLSLKDHMIYKIDGASLRHIEEFLKLEAQPNKSLDASGGSVFLNLIRSAMLD